MARRGIRPKSTVLRLVDGTHRTTRHGGVDKAKSQIRISKSLGRPRMPKRFTGAAEQAWKDFIEPAFWLDRARERAAIAFCDMTALYERAPNQFPAAKHGHYRAYMSELGLTDERNRKLPEDDEEESLID